MRAVGTALVLVGLATQPARADAKASAKQRVEAASAHHAAGRFTEALHELTAAYSLHPRADVLYAIAQVHVKLGDCALAITFYERFLSTRPSAGAADAAHEAIETCRTQPPPAPATALPAPPAPQPPVAVTAPPTTSEPRRWYKDPVGGGLVGAGLACGVISLISYRGATGDLDAAETAETYPHMPSSSTVRAASARSPPCSRSAESRSSEPGPFVPDGPQARAPRDRRGADAHGGFVTWSGTW